jgi:hypothetical protein
MKRRAASWTTKRPTECTLLAMAGMRCHQLHWDVFSTVVSAVACCEVLRNPKPASATSKIKCQGVVPNCVAMPRRSKGAALGERGGCPSEPHPALPYAARSSPCGALSREKSNGRWGGA